MKPFSKWWLGFTLHEKDSKGKKGGGVFENVLIIIYAFSMFTIAIPTRDHTVCTVAEALEEKWFVYSCSPEVKF